MRTLSAGLAALLIIIVAATGVYRAQQIVWLPIEDHFYEFGTNPGFVPVGKEIKPMILGFDHAVADIYWLKTVQYAGAQAGIFEFDALPDYIELVTDLDPQFGFAYTFGALLLPLSEKSLSAVRPLLEKGIAANRTTHPELLPELFINLAFFTYFYENNNERAAELYEECAQRIAGCPKFASNVAAFLRAKVGKFEISLRLWLDKVLTEEANAETYQVALRNIEQSAKMAAISCAAQNYQRSTGKPLGTLQDLIGSPVSPCSAFTSLTQQQLSVLGRLSQNWGLNVISDKTLTTPFVHNSFQWDTINNRLRTKLW